MTIVIPTEKTPAGVKCWVRDYDFEEWKDAHFKAIAIGTMFPFKTKGYGDWNFCRLDDPVEGWVENTGTAPDVKVPIEIKLRSGAVSCLSNVGASIAVQWRINCVSSDITHWRYPRTETKEPEMKPHPQADILRRIADGEDLTGRLWILSADGSYWLHTKPYRLIDNPQWTFAVSDEPGVPPPLPRPMIQLRPGGPKYYRGETVAPGDETRVWLARAGFDDEVNSDAWLDWSDDYKSNALRLGLVHLSEASYRLHVAALEDLLMWAQRVIETQKG